MITIMIFLANPSRMLFLYFHQEWVVVLVHIQFILVKSNNSAPLAMICQKADLTVATGCALANIPLITLNVHEEFDSIKNGMKLSLNTDSSNLIQYQ